ncbi:MAG: hypothetical protein RI897_2895 [Verrucomicrobiota bacterium]|jgi:serine/threonine-protein kinase
MKFFQKNQSKAVARAFLDKERYRFIREVGEGGLSSVGSFYDSRLNRVVALKTLQEEHVGNEELVRFFINEAKLLGYLDHPGVVPVFDTFLREKDTPCYTMKLCQGLSLASLLDAYKGPNRGPIPLARTVEIFTKLAETLAYVHDKGVLHLDLKPDNIIVGTYGEVILLDWGSARLYSSEKFYEHLGQHTEDTEVAYFEKERESLVLGTPRYMSPEQVAGEREHLTCASDLFSAGIILYEMLTSLHPFPAKKPSELMDQVLKHDPPRPHEINREIPRKLSHICWKMLAKKPEDRYQGFHEVLEELASYHGVGDGFPVQDYIPGEVIFNEGDSGEYAFLIMSGEVEILKEIGEPEPKVIARLGVGEIVGELAVISHSPRTAAARAATPVRIRILSKADIEQELEKLSPWVSKMISGLTGRFIDLRDKYLELERKLQDKQPPANYP